MTRFRAEDEPVSITPYVDGPLLVRGPFRLVTPDGEEIDLRRRTVALCRCGRSAIKPFCDGSHKAVGFRAPAGDSRAATGRGSQSAAGPEPEPAPQRPRVVRGDA